MIHEAGDHLLAMIGDLLDLSLAEAAHLPIHLQNVRAGAAVRVVRGLVPAAGRQRRRERAQRGPRRRRRADARIAVVRADPTRLRQVLTNLLSNAVKYNRRGGRVTLRAQAAGDEWHIEVEDTGHGISPSDRARLFQPFNRLGREASGIAGAGLGLALSQSLAQLMGGRITAQSVLGVGSTFRVSLPAA